MLSCFALCLLQVRRGSPLRCANQGPRVTGAGPPEVTTLSCLSCVRSVRDGSPCVGWAGRREGTRSAARVPSCCLPSERPSLGDPESVGPDNISWSSSGGQRAATAAFAGRPQQHCDSAWRQSVSQSVSGGSVFVFRSSFFLLEDDAHVRVLRQHRRLTR